LRSGELGTNRNDYTEKQKERNNNKPCSQEIESHCAIRLLRSFRIRYIHHVSLRSCLNDEIFKFLVTQCTDFKLAVTDFSAMTVGSVKNTVEERGTKNRLPLNAGRTSFEQGASSAQKLASARNVTREAS
jgi:hypothetical protein